MTKIVDFSNDSCLFGEGAAFVEGLYEQYRADPTTIDKPWRDYFDQLSLATQAAGFKAQTAKASPAAYLHNDAEAQRPCISSPSITLDHTAKQIAVIHLIQAYRNLGVYQANLDPLKVSQPLPIAQLSVDYYQLTDADMSASFDTDIIGMPSGTLAQIIDTLRQTYCDKIAIEQNYLTDPVIQNWIQQRFEEKRSRPNYAAEKKKQILQQLTAAETLERYLHTKYVGQKRFSLEGGESTLVAINHLIEIASQATIQEIIIGMAHRGRLNMLVNALGKPPSDLFAEFEGRQAMNFSSGDVKYHMGFSADVLTEHGKIHLNLAFNPSHLESVNPVVQGSVRARQYHKGNNGKSEVLPVLIHGDAAFIGLGVNQGTFNLSQTRGYNTGGTIHIVINNQIGFTTSAIEDTRSTRYCTDIAKMVEAPVFHVNGDDPEAVCFVIEAALAYRLAFQKDIVVDIVCYRKWGHNEGDDPSLTQPLIYQRIAQQVGVRESYAQHLIAENILSITEAETMVRQYRSALDKGELDKHVRNFVKQQLSCHPTIEANAYSDQSDTYPVVTALNKTDIVRLTEKFTQLPSNFIAHNAVSRVLKMRLDMAHGKQMGDWGFAETLAYASLLEKGYKVRLSGEDSGRGTFAHRHAVLHDQTKAQITQKSYIPLHHISSDQGQFEVIDSVLNEEAVLAFEYGYSIASPETLVVWEAQFGDFANGAQVIIDQFITSGEAKWGQLSGLTLILPHGYDGQGPEHSSARIERYLQLAAEHNIQIVMPSQASQIFHVLRRQVLTPQRKPLIIMLSKRLLRLKEACSPIGLFTADTFRLIIADSVIDAAKAARVIICSGQIYYDLVSARTERTIENIAIIRVEQLYPFPLATLRTELAKYKGAKEIVWVQEEPGNQGAWRQIRHYLEQCIEGGQNLNCVARPSSASPAVGYLRKHQEQLKTLINKALDLDRISESQ